MKKETFNLVVRFLVGLALSLLIPCRTPAAPAGIMKKSDLNEAVAMLKLIAEKC